MKTKYYTYLLLLPLLFSFASAGESAEKHKKAFMKLMLGKWQSSTSEGSFTETWELSNNQAIGKGTWMQADKIVMTEEIELRIIEGRLLYSVKDAKKGFVDFAFIPGKSQLKKGVFWFENPQHDFPKYIRYSRICSTRVDVKVWGENDNKEEEGTFILRMSKIN